jgi:hypothetical protein
MIIRVRDLDIEDDIRSGMQDVGTDSPRGNLSIHECIRARGIEIEHSDYRLDLQPLTGRDAAVWNKLSPRPTTPSSEPFIRLTVVTRGAGHGPLLASREYLVPAVFTLRVSGFKVMGIASPSPPAPIRPE